jgi:hypothetical protein
MCETPDCWDVLADKMIGWMDPNNAPHDRTAIAVNYLSVANFLRGDMPPTHERQVALRKLLESYTWAMRISSLGFCPKDITHENQLATIKFWLAEMSDVEACQAIGYHFYNLDVAISRAISRELGHRLGPVTFERVQAARLLLESRDAAVRACLDMLAEQQKQELRVVSQS